MNLAKLIFGLLLGRRLPVTSGQISVTGLRRPVRIDRDAWGIPSITAENDPDAWFGLGFCQGQDRAFQLEGMLRVVRGTLSELVGPEALPIALQRPERLGLFTPHDGSVQPAFVPHRRLIDPERAKALGGEREIEWPGHGEERHARTVSGAQPFDPAAV